MGEVEKVQTSRKAEGKNWQTHAGHRERLKQRCLSEGLDGFDDHQVLELLLFYAVPYKDTNVLAHSLLAHFGSFAGVLNADFDQLLRVDGVGKNTATLLSSLPDFFRRYQLDMFGQRACLDSLEDAGDYCSSLFVGCAYETFYLICLDRQRRVIRAAQIGTGSIGQVAVFPRVAVETALRHRAASVILSHNHPGGSMQASGLDVQLTTEIESALATIDVEVLDHIIIARGQYFSLGQKGLFKGKLI